MTEDVESHGRKGIPCKACGSGNTTSDSVLRQRPSLIAFLCFGFIFLLIRGAFAMRTSVCRDCGASRRYKSAGSWVALAVLAFILTIFLIECIMYPEEYL